MKTCKICKITKPLDEFNPASKYKDKVYYRSECKPCNLQQQSSNQTAQIKYRNSENGKAKKSSYKKTDKYKAYQKEYDKVREHTEARKLSKYSYIKKRLQEDPFYRLRLNVRNRLRGAIKVKGWHKDNSFKQYIGCSIEELKTHIEKQFTSEMNWDNYAIFWEIDHIIALGNAKNEEEIYKLCHYTNLCPLSIKDHKAKTILDVIAIKKSK